MSKSILILGAVALCLAGFAQEAADELRPGNEANDAKLARLLESPATAQIHFTKGLWSFNTNATFGPTVHVLIDAGAMLQPGRGATLKFSGPFDAPNMRIFDFAQGGHVSFPSLAKGQSQARVRAIQALWFGVGNGNGTPDTTAFAELFSSIGGISSEIEFTPGIYNIGSQQTIPSRCVLRGAGNRNAVQFNSTITNANSSPFLIPKGAQDVVIDNINFATTFTAPRNPFTNQFAITVEPGVDRIAIRRCTFNKFQGGGIFIDGGAINEGNLHGEIIENLFLELRNASTNGGNGLRPAIGILGTNTISSMTIRGNKFDQCDQGAWFNQGPRNGIGAIRWLENIVENCGRWGTVATNATAFEMSGILRMDNPYFEANQVRDVVYLSGGATNRPMRSFLLTGGEIDGDHGGVVYSTNAITGNNVAHARVIGTIFNAVAENFARNLNPYENGVWTLEDTAHDIPRGAFHEASIAAIQSRLVGPIVIRRGNWKEFFVQTSDVTVANTAAETALLGSGIGLNRIPANYLSPGTTLRGELIGKLSAGAQSLARIRVKLDSATLLDSGPITLSDAITNEPVAIHFQITGRSPGASITGAAQIAQKVFPLSTSTAKTLDTTLLHAIEITFQWGAANPANTVTISDARIE